ncbi:MAG: response regulator [Candidatus Riflebacteria bacterium]|nr:response regulator [Candidatus Riflebacteria bacterium]
MIADPNQTVIDTLKKILESDERIQVVATCLKGGDCKRKAQVSKPIVVIMDLKFADMGGGRVIKELATLRQDLAVLVLSPHAVKGSPLLAAAVAAGAFDYILRPPNYKELEKLSRQILTNVFVATVSKAKWIPRREGGPEGEEEKGGAERHLEAVLVDVAADRLRDCRDLLTNIKTRIQPAVIVLLRRDQAFLDDFAQDIQSRITAPFYSARPGDFIQPGRIYMLGLGENDLVAERNMTGWIEIRQVAPLDGSLPAETPSVVRLVESLGRTFARNTATVTVGGSSPRLLEALAAAKRLDGLAVIEEKSKLLLEMATKQFPKGEVPDDILGLPQIQALINGA